MSGHRQWREIRRGAARPDREPLRTLGELRRETGLSQQEMAEEMGVSQASVSKLERQDDPQISTLMHYISALGANLELRAIFPDRAVSLYFCTDEEAVSEKPADGTETVGRVEATAGER